ncbi:MAG: hypothetical protein ACPL4I_12135, partial [Bacteroidota bacterium]
MEIGPCVDLNAVDEHPYHKVILNMRASDPNCDLVCAGYGGILPGEFVVPKTPTITVIQMVCSCDEDQVYKPLDPCNAKAIWAWAQDAKGNRAVSDPLIIKPPNQPPAVLTNYSKVTEVGISPGKTVSATVTATDPDGDTITLEKAIGPGRLPKVSGQGWVQGTWSWDVPLSLPSTYSDYVAIVARDICGDADSAVLHLHTLNPPKATDAHVTVRRGEETLTETYAYVHDPDSTWTKVQVGPTPAAGLSVSAHVEDDPLGSGMGGFMVVFEVTAASFLCPGTYEVPFTVADPDGLSS